MQYEASSKAIVIGGSMAGMLTARVLADYYEQVLIIERDHFPEEPLAREGVPQGRHLHALLAKGHSIVEELFPGITVEWCEAGAEILDVGDDFAWRTPKGWGIRFSSGVRMLAASRPLIDHVVRRRISSIRRISLVPSAVVESLNLGKNGAVNGVVVRPCGGGARQTINAGLVVDASGRMSRAPEWLETLGYSRPKETVVNAHLGYATRVYRRTRQNGAWRALYIQAAPPDQTRAGIAFPIEGDRWIVTTCGGGRDYAPTDEPSFLEFIRSLPDQQLYNLVTTSEPLSPIIGYRRMENRWRHFERLSRQPEGFVVVGDAVCAFNPVYGQGMTTAALGAMALKSVLADCRDYGLPARFQRRLARMLKTPWILATGEDVRYRNVVGAKPGPGERFMQSYVDRIMAVTTRDAEVRLNLLRVFTMLAGPETLFRPFVIWRVIKDAIRGMRPKFLVTGVPADPRVLANRVLGHDQESGSAQRRTA
jgi:flavin-dependent dehydrogenase